MSVLKEWLSRIEIHSYFPSYLCMIQISNAKEP